MVIKSVSLFYILRFDQGGKKKKNADELAMSSIMIE
jgi:hypothetical protein